MIGSTRWKDGLVPTIQENWHMLYVGLPGQAVLNVFCSRRDYAHYWRGGLNTVMLLEEGHSAIHRRIDA